MVLAKAAAIALSGYIIARVISPQLEKGVSMRVNPHIGRITKNLVFYTIIGIALVTAVGQFVDLTAFLAAVGIAGLAIGLASQRTISNIISGLFLLIDQPFAIGDAVSIDGDGGVVIDMSLLSTRLRTFDNKYLRISNETVAGGRIINYSKFDIRRVELEVGIAYKEDVGSAIEVLTEVVEAHENVLVEPKPLILATRFSDSSIDIAIRVWVPRTEFFAVKSDLIKEAKRALEEAGIEIPFPHRTIYFGSGNKVERFKGR